MSKSDLISVNDLMRRRPNPLAWEEEEQPQGVFISPAADEQLALLGTPSLVVPPEPRLPDDFEPNPELRDWLAALVAALDRVAAGETSAVLPSLTDFDDDSRQAIREILGEGEVTGNLHLDGVQYEITESVLTGVWRLRGDDGSDWVEVGTVPQPVLTASQSLQPATYRVPEPQGEVMNAPPVLSEISHRALTWEGGENHVINFTLLPMSPDDNQLLIDVLGRAELVLNSGGFGDCRVMATRFRHVWAVQFINAMGHTILDTIEIGGVPKGVCAAQEDFEDSAERLGGILGAYLG